MRKVFFTLVAVALTVFYINAQIAIEKMPPSFNKNIKTPLVTKKLPAFDIKAMLAEDEITKGEGPIRFGKRHPVDVMLTNDGTWEELPNGDRIWRMTFYSPKAYSLNFLFSRFYMPQGAELYAYNADRSEVRGAFTALNNKADGMFAITPIQGDKVTLEYYEPAAVNGQGIMQISYVVHAYRNLHTRAEEILEKGFGDSGACNNDVACPVSAGWEDQIRSVGMTVIGGFRLCSGAMVNNTAQDGTPYFLSADHCGININSNWSFVFNYDSPSCNGPDGNFSQSVVGGVLRAASSASDFALFELSSQPPASYNVYYAGWNNQNVAATSTVAIHHPANDVKKISFNDDPAYEGAWGSGSSPVSGGTHWVVDNWEDGTTEGGSSGSPLFDQNKLIIGQLHGGSASCNSITYDSYGKFFNSWLGGGSPSNSLENWLGMGSGVGTLQGTYFPTCAGVDLDINFDVTPQQTSWEITDASGNIVASSGGNTYNVSLANSNLSLPNVSCLPDGCYDLTFYDSINNGMCPFRATASSSGTFITPGTLITSGSVVATLGTVVSPSLCGNYTLYDATGNTIVSGGGGFGASETNNFCLVNGVAQRIAPKAAFGFNNKTKSDVISMNIYPTLTSEFITIHYTGNENTQINIIDINGKILQQHSHEKNTDKTFTLNVADIPTGIYFIQSISTNGLVMTEKFIKK